jgi:hypothetical protein
MTYRAPLWLWTAQDASTVDLDDEKNALAEPASVADQDVKQMFLDTASEDHKRFAFAPEAMPARRMYQILRKGIFGQWSMMEANAITDEWDKLRPEDDVIVLYDEAHVEDDASDAASAQRTDNVGDVASAAA